MDPQVDAWVMQVDSVKGFKCSFEAFDALTNDERDQESNLVKMAHEKARSLSEMNPDWRPSQLLTMFVAYRMFVKMLLVDPADTQRFVDLMHFTLRFDGSLERFPCVCEAFWELTDKSDEEGRLLKMASEKARVRLTPKEPMLSMMKMFVAYRLLVSVRLVNPADKRRLMFLKHFKERFDCMSQDAA